MIWQKSCVIFSLKATTEVMPDENCITLLAVKSLLADEMVYNATV